MDEWCTRSRWSQSTRRTSVTVSYSCLFFVCVQHTYTQPVINQIDKNKKNFSFFFLLEHHYQLALFFSLYFYSFVDVNFSFFSSLSLSFFLCVCVCVLVVISFFSLAVCSFSFSTVRLFSFVYSCVVGIVCLM